MSAQTIPPRLTKGRGAASAATSDRFGLPRRETDGDWLDECRLVDNLGDKPDESPGEKLRTTVIEETAKTIISYNQSPDIPFDRSINAYRGCEHGCIYCFARPTHAWHDLSPGLDFETKLFAKPDAPRLLREALARPAYRCAPIAMGTNTDPYQPIEGRYRITRQVLEICLAARQPVTITTKSDRVLRDLDLLAELARLNLVAVALSVTSLDPQLSARLEPRAAAPAKRLAALGRLVSAGVPAHVSIAPVIPAITDCFIEQILGEAAARGITSAGWIMLRLPHEVAPLFREWLMVHYPDRADKVMAIVRSVRGGRDNDPSFFSRMKPSGTWADLFRARFLLACKRNRINTTRHVPRLDCDAFRRPSPDGQLELF